MYYYYDYYLSNISIQRCVLWFIYFFVHPFPRPFCKSSCQKFPATHSIPHPILSKQQAYYLNLTGVSKNRGGIYPQIIHGFLLGFSILFTINHPFWGKLPPIFGNNLIDLWICWLWQLHPPVRRRVGAKNCGQSAVQLLGIGLRCQVGWLDFFREPQGHGGVPQKNGKIAHTIPISTRFSLEPTFFFF